MNYDKFGFIVNADGDGGDTCQREFMYAFLLDTLISTPPHQLDSLVKKYVGRLGFLDITKLEQSPGIYIRHPDPTKWYSNPKTTSRDQLVPVIWYCAGAGDSSRLRRLFKACLSRGMFAQNTEEKDGKRKLPDCIWGNIGDFIRAAGSSYRYLYPLLLVGDFANLIETIVWLLTPRPPDDVDDNNRILGHIGAALYMPTPISRVSRYLYARFRPRSLGSATEKNRVLAALAWYHRAEAGGNPEFVELFRPLINKYFKEGEDRLT